MNAPDRPHAHKKLFLTIAFWDISGFSKLCSALTTTRISDTIVKFLSEYYDDVEDTVTKNEGVVDKFMGDGVMAIFGSKGHEDDAISAVRAALQLRKSFIPIKSKWVDIWKRESDAGFGIGLKCGIATGEVILAEIGSGDRRQETAIGSAVNNASRLVGLAGHAKDSAPSDILVSQITQTRIIDSGEFFVQQRITTIEALKQDKTYVGIEGGFRVIR